MCLADVCIEKIVTDQAEASTCSVRAAQAIPDWMRINGYLDRGYSLQSWTCGAKRTRA
jgi:hypothetical protein